MKRLMTAGLLVAFGLSAVAAAPFKIGMAGFSFWKTPLDEALATMKTINCHHLCIKDYFLPLDADDAQIADVRGVFKALADVNYTGVCHIEYERDFGKNALALAESFGYYCGVLNDLGL